MSSIASLPKKAAYVRAWRECKRQAAHNPDAMVRSGDWYGVSAQRALRGFKDALNARINARGGIVVSTARADANWWHWYRDSRAIQDYRLRRIVRLGSGLESAAGRRVAPDVHRAFTAWRDD